MYWSIINKTSTVQPTSGTYSDWKPDLAIEGSYRCVYCAIKDVRLGGIRNFHVEHYKPKALFPTLINTISNLFYSCPICNVFKSDDWHEPTGNLDDICYPDPSEYDYTNLFELRTDGTLVGLNNSGKYIINKLGLNRNQLVIDRQFSHLLEAYKEIKDEFRGIRDQLMAINTIESREILTKMTAAFDKIIDRKDKLYEAEPYQLSDTKKVKIK